MAANLDVQAYLGATTPPEVCTTKRAVTIHDRKEQNEVAEDEKTFFVDNL